MLRSTCVAATMYAVALLLGYAWLQFFEWMDAAAYIPGARVLAGPVPLLFSHSGFGFFSIFSVVLIIPLLLVAEVRWARRIALGCFCALWLVVGMYLHY